MDKDKIPQITDDEFQDHVNKQYEEKPDEKPDPSTTISNNQFIGVQFDPSTIETVYVVAKALLNITELFKAQNVKIDSMLYVNTGPLPRTHTTATIIEKD